MKIWAYSDTFSEGKQLTMKNKLKGKQVGLNIVFIILSLIFIVPFLMLLSVSLSNERDVWEYGYRLIPKKIDLSAYRWVFRNPGQILQAYKTTIIFTVATTVLGTFVTAIAAYPLAQRDFKHRNIVSGILFFSMMFSAGVVPTYIWETQYLKMGNTIWVYILPNLVNVTYIFMVRTFFQGIPEEIREAAIVDGAGEFTIFSRIIIPLAKPAIATVALFIFLSQWNNWYTSMIYITKDELVSLQYLLQRILEEIELLTSDEVAAQQIGNAEIPSETVRMAMAVTVAGPALFIFPFFQKYFVKGLTIGGVKG